MSVCIEKVKHEACGRNAVQVYANEESGKVDGFCFYCSTYVANPYGKPRLLEDVKFAPPKTEEEIEESIAEIKGYPFVDVAARRLRAVDLEAFGVRVALSEEDGKTPSAMYFPIYKDGKITGYYGKTLSKPRIQWAIGDVRKAPPFNWHNAKKSGAYRLIITEGLEDAVSVHTIYRLHGKEEFQPAVISLPNGVMSVKSSLAPLAEEIQRTFKEIVLCFDNDEAGQKAVGEAMQIFPMAKTVTLPYKDANDCILQGAKKAAFKALSYQAQVPKNTRLISGNDLHIPAREPTPWGELTWPFPTMNKLLRNIRYGETIYIGAGVKMGKSELLDQIAAHFIKEHEVPVLLIKPEEENKKSYKKLANKIAGTVFTDPSVEFDYKAYDKAGEVLKDKVWLIDLYQHISWETLKKDIVSAAALGVKAVFIDPITNLTNGMSAGDANSKLQEIAQGLSSIALDMNIVIFIFCHLKEPEGNITRDVRRKKYASGEFVGLGNCPHERGGDVLSSQFAGSRGMMRSCNLMLGLEGNKDPELPLDKRSLRWLSILEDREFGNSGKICLHYNTTTTQYREA